MMTLEIRLPDRQALFAREVEQVVAESTRGSFCLLPRHVDFADLLVPGLLRLRRQGQDEVWAVDEGVLVKRADRVRVVTRRAVGGRPLEELADEVDRLLGREDDAERSLRDALANLEANLVRRFVELDLG